MKFGIGPDAHIWGKFKRRFRGDYVRRLHIWNETRPNRIGQDDLLALVEKPMQPFLHPVSGDMDTHRQYMSLLGSGYSGLSSMPCPDLPGHGRPQLSFNWEAYESAHRRNGANCGPGALAAVLGIHIDQAVEALPQFARYGFTTEVMMAVGLARFGQPFDWALARPDLDPLEWPSLGLVRIAFEGGWTAAGDRMEELQRSHWVATNRKSSGQLEIFDINSIWSTGWMDFKAWREEMVPWIVDRLVDGANGAWHVVETIEIHRERPIWH